MMRLQSDNTNFAVGNSQLSV